MKRIAHQILMAVLILSAAGCASTKTYNQQRVETGKIPRPNQIWVYDFVATPADIPRDSQLAQTYTIVASPQTAEQIQLGRELGGKIADRLVQEIRDMGMPASRAFTTATTTTQPNDIVVRGYLTSIDKGSTAGRMAIGFGAGASELQTVVEGLQVTPQGLRMIGSATVEAKGAKTPGAGMGAATWAVTGNPAGFIV